MSIISALAGKIVDHVSSYLPWYYKDLERNVSIEVTKMDNGSLHVLISDDESNEVEFIEVPRAEIERLLKL